MVLTNCCYIYLAIPILSFWPVSLKPNIEVYLRFNKVTSYAIWQIYTVQSVLINFDRINFDNSHYLWCFFPSFVSKLVNWLYKLYRLKIYRLHIPCSLTFILHYCHMGRGIILFFSLVKWISHFEPMKDNYFTLLWQ